MGEQGQGQAEGPAATTTRSRSSSIDSQGPIGRKPGTRRIRGSTLAHQKDMMRKWVTGQGGGEGEKRQERGVEGEKRKRPEQQCSKGRDADETERDIMSREIGCDPGS